MHDVFVLTNNLFHHSIVDSRKLNNLPSLCYTAPCMEALLTNSTIFLATLSLLWILFYIARPETRREMTILSVLALFLLPLTFTLGGADPQEVREGFGAVRASDLLFLFTAAGVSSVLFHAFFGKHYHALPKTKRASLSKKDSHANMWILRLTLTLLFLSWGTLLIHILFSLALAPSLVLASIMLAIYIASHRHDLLMDAVWSGLLTAFTVGLAASVAASLAPDSLTFPFTREAYLLGGISIDLLLWSFAIGITLGPLYEYSRRLTLK